MLCVTHDLTLASQISEKVVFLDRGVVRAEEKIQNLAKDHLDPQVRMFFGGKE
jgi:polar amino acid transport system ATP-binding protein